MLRNLIFGSLLAPLGAALPLVVTFLGVGMGRGLTGDSYAMTAGLGQSFYVIVGAYFFGWIAALLVGAGNGLAWLLVSKTVYRILLSIPVGCVAALLTFGHMLFGVGGLTALPALAMFCALGALGSLFSAVLIAIGSRWPSAVRA
jgi:hypothetical protein